MKCPNCEMENPEGSSFCNGCGASTNPFKSKDAPSIKWIKNNQTLVILGAIGIVCLLLLLAYSSGLIFKTNEVKITVVCSGDWVCAYGDQSGIQSISGTGTKTVTLQRPNNVDDWAVVANAMSLYGNYLTVKITKMDGTVLAQKSGNFGMVMVTAEI